MRVLVVEDEKRLAAGLRKGLEAEGFAVDVALDGGDGLWMAREHHYDAIVLDIMLPGVNGYMTTGPASPRQTASASWSGSSASTTPAPATPVAAGSAWPSSPSWWRPTVARSASPTAQGRRLHRGQPPSRGRAGTHVRWMRATTPGQRQRHPGQAPPGGRPPSRALDSVGVR
jgi:CheY-like chemotaxis protein